jgi:hypothetical protein
VAGDNTNAMRHLWIVARDRPDVYEYFKTRLFIGRPNVEVILDRREGERRERTASPSPERRQGDRRQTSVEDDLASLGIAIVRRP